VRSRRIEIERRADRRGVPETAPSLAPLASPPQAVTLPRPEIRLRPALAGSASPPGAVARTAAQFRRRKSVPLASEHDEEARKRFAEFWDQLLPGENPAQPIEQATLQLAPLTLEMATLQIPPLPRSRSLVMMKPAGALSLWAPARPLRRPKPAKPAIVHSKKAVRRFTADAIRWGHRD
jgi:hypothetical protein